MKLTEERLIEIIKEEIEANSAAPITQTTDDIIAALGSLYDSLTEDLNEIEEISEADGTPSKAIQWIWWGPKAKKAQGKVNKIKLNTVALEFAKDNAEDKDAKAKLDSKLKQTKEQSKSLQTMVDDKFSAKGEVTKRALASAKIKGQLEVIKKTTGMTDDPNKNKELKDQMKELNTKLKKEDEALKSLEPDKEELKAAAEEKKAAAEKAKAAAEKTKADAAAAAAAEAPADDAGADDAGADDAGADDAGADDAGADDAGAGVTKSPTEETPEEKTKREEEEEKEKKKKGAKESKTTKDYKRVLNESKYHSQSIRDKFSRLL